MTELLRFSALPATPPESLAKVSAVEEMLLRAEQLAIRTEHVLHGGMYARTIRIPDIPLEPGELTILTGALIKRATMLIINGDVSVFAGSEWYELVGYQVIAASSGRKQMFVPHGPVEVTMIFPTSARTVEEAEAEFTDEADRLMSRRSDTDMVTITGE